MVDLVPVDHDPFAAPKTIPVDHDPFAPTTTPMQQFVGNFMNVGPAASQGVTPDVSQHAPNLISADVHESDTGDLLYKDPKTGELVPTNTATQVAIRDPNDNRIKVYARSPETEENKAVSISRILSPGLMAGAPTARPGLALNMRPPIAPSSSEIKEAAKRGYEAARATGVELKTEPVKNLGITIKSSLNEQGIDEVLAPKVFGVLEKLEAAPEGGTFTIDNFRTLQRTLGNAAKSPDPTERLAAVHALRTAGKYMEDIPPSALRVGTPEEAKSASDLIREANANYAAAKRSELLQGKLERADLNAGSANSGANVDNAIRQQIKTILTNPKLQRGFSPEEIAQMNAVVRGTAPGNVVRTVGNLLGGGGGLGSVVTAGAGAFFGGAPGALLPVLGAGIKQLGNVMTTRQAMQLDNLVRSRAPLAKSLESWSEKHRALVETPTAPRYGQFLLASRNLVNNLKDSGIDVALKDVIRTMQYPIKAEPSDEQK